jgi:hypothetical protein
MPSHIRRAFTFANVCSALALTIALATGTAYAANTVFSTDIVNGEVKTADVAAKAVTASKLRAGSVRGVAVLDESISMLDVKGAAMSGAVSFNSGLISNGRCKDFDITTPGTKPGEAVVLSLREPAPEGVLFQAVRVPTADHTIMKLCNLTGATFPGISDLGVRVVSFG